MRSECLSVSQNLNSAGFKEVDDMTCVKMSANLELLWNDEVDNKRKIPENSQVMIFWA